MQTKTIALTFDDGPSSDIMPQLLQLLQEYQAQATFFLWGDKITTETAPLLNQALAQGCELGNHSMRHLHMGVLTAEEVRQETQPLQELVETITGVKPVLFRPPYLDISETMQQVIPLPFITGASTKDWTPETSAADRLNLALQLSQDGAILLMHCFEGNAATVEAVRSLLPQLKQQGYRITTVSQLFTEKGVTPLPGTVYASAVPAQNR